MENRFQKIKKIRTRLSKVLAVLVIIAFIFGEQRYYLSGLGSGIVDIVALLLVTVGTLGRVWCGFYISGFKNKKVVTDGPYSITRNPLYLFSLIGAIGIGLVTHSLAVLSFIIIGFAIYYPFVIVGEERKLASILGDDYQNYIKRVPRFFPKFSLFTQPKEYTVKPKVFYKDLRDVTMFIVTYCLILLINILKTYAIIPTQFPIF
ncbi:isoprenylcysteine carboxylmethyltransferase family protein [bacterium]|nr:isoprenylcysteine carboxylmethyltransferase family protein [bacterium]